MVLPIVAFAVCNSEPMDDEVTTTVSVTDPTSNVTLTVNTRPMLTFCCAILDTLNPDLLTVMS